ncbi:LOW QUALITY PROTEIN: hypothetical protein KUTeg_006025 [Tegillarca granosa]|uniref:Chitin-binding type-2 domain-containing protein n=1 Tax=Tegillarca granosa TaxID=220873 RepID=A0ABQ9FFC3_TEGGR|nr:LOW QUALITY PROTEIN: hypothetical protein KUTeg_006025 [Tegillarca granosa]
MIVTKKFLIQSYLPMPIYSNMIGFLSGDMSSFCKANPQTVVPHPNNCGQYYNCSVQSKYGNFLQECHYPDLFDEVTLTCVNFTTTSCNSEYIQNQCNMTIQNCTPCPKRLPSCVGHPDGDNAFPNRLWKSDYIKCYMNRTMDITYCTKVDVPDYCSANPAAIVADPDNCSHYFNCSDTPAGVSVNDGVSISLGNYSRECLYPSLFDSTKKKCENFTSVNCDKRMEPQAPCEYKQNTCDPNNNTCDPCPQRLPSCVGQADGQNEFPTKLWKRDYIQCFLNRTMTIEKCLINEYFNPRLKQCMDHVDTVDVPAFCHENPTVILPDPNNCAHYFNCSDPGTSGVVHRSALTPSSYRKECTYPDLFDVANQSEYEQNLCSAVNTACTNCSERLPSCVGKTDGKQAFPTREWKKDYLQCYKNRTMVITKCQKSEYFNPRKHKCMTDVETVDVPDFCKANPQAILPDPDNCAHYFNCSQNSSSIHRKLTSIGNYRVECSYPDLFDQKWLTCHNFTNVTCDHRPEPQAPCEYQQNLCDVKNTMCKPCQERLPSCKSKMDGPNPFPTKLWTDSYISCYKNRTLDIKNCSAGQYFNPRKHTCMTDVLPGEYDQNLCNSTAVNCEPCSKRLKSCRGLMEISLFKMHYGPENI